MEGEGGEEGEAADVSSEVKEASPPSENPDQEVIVEALKSICNILLHNQTGQVSLFLLHVSFSLYLFTQNPQVVLMLIYDVYFWWTDDR